MPTRVEIQIKDTMAFWREGIETFTYDPNGYAPTNTYVYSVPDAWIENGALSHEGLERVYQNLYGPNWRLGNGDGSQYVVLESRSRVLPADDTRKVVTIEG
jgi:hypothetical protein